MLGSILHPDFYSQLEVHDEPASNPSRLTLAYCGFKGGSLRWEVGERAGRGLLEALRHASEAFAAERPEYEGARATIACPETARSAILRWFYHPPYGLRGELALRGPRGGQLLAFPLRRPQVGQLADLLQTAVEDLYGPETEGQLEQLLETAR